MKKRLGTILFIIYFLVAIIITHELLSYNKYNIIEYKNSYIVTLNDDSLYKKSDSSDASKFQSVTPTITTPATFLNNQSLFTLKAGITKIRIYMWVEGQDVDCENNASGGSIKFDLKITTNAE